MLRKSAILEFVLEFIVVNMVLVFASHEYHQVVMTI
jgi:hypothetical protein